MRRVVVVLFFAFLQVLLANFEQLTPSSEAATPSLSVTGGYFRPPGKKRVIVFVNGIFGDAISTWKNPNGAYWPELLTRDKVFDGFDIYIHSFESPKITAAQNIDELAARLKDYLHVDKVLDHEQIIFICHSMGGLVVRAFLMKERLSPKKIPMIYFYGTPTAGANVAEIASHLSENPQLKDMLPFEEDGYLKVLREAWFQTTNDPSLNYPNVIASFCGYEILKAWQVKIVKELSAVFMCNRENRAVLANHIDMVKPGSARAEPYVYFKAAYEKVFGAEEKNISKTIADAASRPVGPEGTNMRIPSSGREPLVLKRRKVQSVDAVRCGETLNRTVESVIGLEKYERVIDVRPSFENLINVKSSFVALIWHWVNTASIQYGLEAACPGVGRADIFVNFIVVSPSEKF